MTKSMTEGSPVKLILSFSLPLLFGSILQQAYNIIDATIVGRVLGADALGAVGASSSVQFLVLGFCIGMCSGFGIPMAKYFGAEQPDRLRSTVFHSYLLTGISAVLLTVVTCLMCGKIVDIMQVTGDIYKDAYNYLFIILAGIPFTLFYNLLSSMLRAIGDSKTPFIFLAISAVLNIILDLTFIVIIPLGCAGAGIATVMAQACSGIACFVVIQKKYPLLRLSKDICRFNGYIFKEVFVMGVPMGLQFSITAIGSMVMQSANNSLEDVYISAFAVTSKLKQLAMCPFEAIATGISVFSGQNLGAGNTDRVKKGIIQGTVINAVYGIVIGIVLIFGGRNLSMIFLDSSETAVLNACGEYMKCVGYFYWALGILFACRMSVQGIGFSGLAIFSGVLEMFARIIVSRKFVPIYKFTAICYTDQIAWIVASLYCTIVCVICVKKASHTNVLHEKIKL
ncbi:MAG: MATE family efflux transporter [Ruminococcus sp.]|nr:MATE family efflux transporter [Ruminococcus sp.]